MSSDNPQNPEQPDEFADLVENAPNPDPESAAAPPEPAPAPVPAPSPPQPDPAKPDQSSQPEGKVDPAKIREKETKSLQEQLERLRKERENQNEVISRLTSTNTKLQEKFDVAEKQHKVQQESAVEVASKAAVRQVAKERDDERKSKKIYMVVMAVVVILLCVVVGHNLFESASSPAKPATQQADTDTESEFVPLIPQIDVAPPDEQQKSNADEASN